MVAGGPQPLRIEKRDGYRLGGLTATGKERRRQQDSRDHQVSKAMRCEPRPIGVVRDTTHRLESDPSGTQSSPPLQRQE
jgi:hypothetical protein